MLHAAPLPAGAAARLVWSVTGDAPLTIRATPTPEAPSDPASARAVITPASPRLPAPPPTRLDHPAGVTRYEQALDLHASLAASPVTYHLYRGDQLEHSVTVDAREPFASAEARAVRDTVRQRLEYHLERAVAAGQLHPRAGYVPVLEQETLERDKPLPTVLLKESLAPSGEEGIGKYTHEDAQHLYRAYRYRARVELLVLSANPAERTELANLIHARLLADFPTLEAAGYHGLSLMRHMRAGATGEGETVFGEEISIDGSVEFVMREEKRYRVPVDGMVSLRTTL